MKLSLPNVTLVMIETMEHALARFAIEECLEQAEFGDVVIFTDNELLFIGGGRCRVNDEPWTDEIKGQRVRFVRVPNWPNKIGWSQCSWLDVPLQVYTSHALCIQWDSFVVDPTAWRDEFLEWDYIGAPWPHHPAPKNVGNGGFSLKSTRLMRKVYKHRDEFPCISSSDDDLLCRQYRPQLEQRFGLTWAPERIARDFAFECAEPTGKTFGFHALFNVPRVLEGDKLRKYIQLAQASKYINGSYMWKALLSKHPHILDEQAAQAAE